MEKKTSFSLSKNLKISQAQQILLLAVLASSIIVGIAIALSLNFLSHITFNATVIGEKDKALVAYSTAFSKIGICMKPKGEAYTQDELKNCNPSTVSIYSIPGTLRYNIINGLATNPSLNSVSKAEVDARCVNPETLENYSIKELNDKYAYAESIEDREAATNLIKTCSALRTIPDALPAYDNQEAMLASLNKIFNISGWLPEGLAPNESDVGNRFGFSGYSIAFSLDADVQTVQTVFRNIERSIRNIDISSATITYSGDDSLMIGVNANAYYVGKTELNEITLSVDPNKTKGKKN